VCNERTFGLAIAFIAGDNHIGIVERIFCFRACFHIFSEGAATRPPQVIFERCSQIEHNHGVILRTAGHGKNFTIAVFVADGADFFGGEVVVRGDVERVGGEHGGCEGNGAIVRGSRNRISYSGTIKILILNGKCG